VARIYQKVKVFIADQQPLFRQGIRHYLAQTSDIEVCGEASPDHDIISAITNSYANIVLLSIDTPAHKSLEIARAIKQQMPSVAVIILTPYPNDNDLFQAIRARAAGYLNRDITPEELTTTIQRAATGEHPINDSLISRPKVAEQVLHEFQDLTWGRGVESFVSPLTPRETEILNLMAQGYLNKQIAASLSISEQTIKNHITSILRKLDANARTEAVVIAIKRGLVTLEEETA